MDLFTSKDAYLSFKTEVEPILHEVYTKLNDVESILTAMKRNSVTTSSYQDGRVAGYIYDRVDDASDSIFDAMDKINLLYEYK